MENYNQVGQEARFTFGVGSLSLLFVVIGVVFGFSVDGVCVGDTIVRAIGLNAWSDSGVHYTVFYSLLFYILAIVLAFIGRKQKHFGAKIGLMLSLAISFVIVIMSIFIA